jgi:hypothetical protein
MKIRAGFVSNSSSSSFVVIMKNGKEMTKDSLLEAFDVKETSPLYVFAKDLTDWIMQNVKKQDIKSLFQNYYYSSEKLTEDEMIDNMVEECSEKYQAEKREELEKIRNNEIFYYEGSAASDSGEGLEYYLCETGINVDNDIITIKSGGGF